MLRRCNNRLFVLLRLGVGLSIWDILVARVLLFHLVAYIRIKHLRFG